MQMRGQQPQPLVISATAKALLAPHLGDLLDVGIIQNVWYEKQAPGVWRSVPAYWTPSGRREILRRTLYGSTAHPYYHIHLLDGRWLYVTAKTDEAVLLACFCMRDWLWLKKEQAQAQGSGLCIIIP